MDTIQYDEADGQYEAESRSSLIARQRVQNRNLYVASAVAILGPLSFGYALGYSSPAIPDMTDKGILNDKQGSLFGSVIALGAMFGGPVTGWLIELSGRKLGAMTCALPFVLGWLAISLSHGIFELLILGRILTGFATGMVSLVVPVYLAEISTAARRGLLGACFQVAVTMGILLAYLMGYAGLNYIWLALIGAIIPSLMVVLMAFMPETPRYLLSKNRRNDALVTLSYLRGTGVDVDDECCEIESNLDQQEQMSLSEFLRPSLYKPLLISLMLMVFQQFSGINAVMFYTVDIFSTAGFKDGHLATVVVGAVQVVFTIIAALFMDKAGRRLLLLIAGIGMTVSSVTFGLYYELTKNDPDDSTHLSWLSLTSMIVYIISFSLGWGAIPWLIMSEIFPSRARGTASAIATLVNWSCAFIVTLTFQDMMHALTNQGTFWFYGAVCFVGVVFVAICVPETKGRTLEQIEEHFQGHSPKYM
ncbi:solute carrier family 2, facilitated glucose transporter member 8-like isoform X2 [Ptychodera flava]|uniref:solute carrier family 2, facilitated glucose transporter member 8-like isoform X2 n=1 Tax=Ptychodera flava TaxID=63121 RepID=UPI00396A238B